MRIGIADVIFHNMEALKEFLISNNIIAETIICVKCNSEAIMMSITGQSTMIKYRCPRRGCQKIQSLFQTPWPLTKVVHVLYVLILGSNYFQLRMFFGISDSSIARYKALLLDCYKAYLDARPIVLGIPGRRIIVEVDESVLSRRGIIRNPTSTDDTVQDTVWILGGVDRTDEHNFFLVRVPDRTVESFTEAMRGRIVRGSRLYTDGHASYPQTARNLGLIHRTVNHSLGFRAPDGTHTNNIEGFWSHMKSTMRKENGVHRENIDDWLIQYTFKRRYVNNSSQEEFAELFIEILKSFFTLHH